jgi:hypothetical protein
MLGACSASSDAEPSDENEADTQRDQAEARQERDVAEESREGSETSVDGTVEDVPVPLGQSGSEGGNRVPCPCGLPQTGNLIRATITDVDGQHLGLRVEEVLPGAVGLSVGQGLTADFAGQLPCWDGCTSVEVGDDVLATYSYAYSCVAETPDDCPGPNPRPAQVRLTHWEDQVVLGRTTEEYRFPVSQLQSLAETTDLSACIDTYGDVSSLPQAFSDTSGPTPYTDCQ